MPPTGKQLRRPAALLTESTENRSFQPGLAEEIMAEAGGNNPFHYRRPGV
jgi:hypothetical protein